MIAAASLAVVGVVGRGLLASPAEAEELTIPLRVRVQPFKNSDSWQPAEVREKFSARGSAIVICDMWDRHWCDGATQRVAGMGPRMDAVLRMARQAGVLVIHAPSDTMEFYKDYPQRLLALHAPVVEPPKNLELPDPPLPIDDSDGGCDTPGNKEHKAWTRETPLLSLGAQDAISDNGAEIYNLLKQRKIQTLFIMGVHTNMCILNRSFAIKQMTRWGMRCVLVRDLTDAMYNPARKPFVSHAVGTGLVIEHIEKHWCPTTQSGDLMAVMERVLATRREDAPKP